jgi:hypothetical protein
MQLSYETWDHVFSGTDVDTLFHSFLNTYFRIVYSSFQFKNLTRRIFGPQRDGVMGGWKKLHNEELRNLYSSPSIIRIIKSRRMRWAGHVA